MLNQDIDIDKVFSEGLGDMEFLPSANVWAGIESKLENRGKKRGLIMVWGMVAAASVLAAIITTVLLFQISDPNKLTSSFAEVNNQTNNTEELSQIMAPTSDKELDLLDNDQNVEESETPIIGFTENNKNEVAVLHDDNSSQREETYLSKHLNYKPLLAKGVEKLIGRSDVGSKQLKSNTTKKYFPLYAYNDDVKSPKDYQVLIGGGMSSAHNYRQTSGAPVRSYDNYSESGFNTLGGSINVRIETSKRWSVETGIAYSQLGQDISSASNYQADLMYGDAMIRTSVSMPKSYTNSLGKIKFNTIGSSSAPKAGIEKEAVNSIYDIALLSDADGIRQSLEYIEVPLMARYKLLDGVAIVSVAGGVSSNILVGNTAYLLDGNSKMDIGETEGIKPVSWSSSFGLGFEVPVSKMIRIGIEPRFKYYLESVSDNTDYSFQPYSFSVFGGITFLLH
nr:outer membrane beta-barrel protein [uncultured Carboxylicivirga sp.]